MMFAVKRGTEMIDISNIKGTPVLSFSEDNHGNCDGFELWLGDDDVCIHYEWSYSDIMDAKRDLQMIARVAGNIMCSSSIDCPEELNLHPDFDLLTYIANTSTDPYMFEIPVGGSIPDVPEMISYANGKFQLPEQLKRAPTAVTKDNVIAVDFGLKCRV